MLTAIVIALYVFAILFDFLPSRKGWAGKDSAVYWIILAISFCLLVLYSLDIKIPGPSEPIKSAIERLFPPK